jgi:hypothetical protein
MIFWRFTIMLKEIAHFFGGRAKTAKDINYLAVYFYNHREVFFYDERRIILDNSLIHEHITSTLDYTNIQKLIFI